MGCGCSLEDDAPAVAEAERVVERPAPPPTTRTTLPPSPLVAHVMHMKMETKVIRTRRRNDAKRRTRRGARQWAQQAAALDLLLPAAAVAPADASTALAVAPGTALAAAAADTAVIDKTGWLLGTLGAGSAFLETAEAAQRRTAAQRIQSEWHLLQHRRLRASRRALAAAVLGPAASPATILAPDGDGRPLRLRSPFLGQQRQPHSQPSDASAAAAESEAAEAAKLLGDGARLGAMLRAVALEDYGHTDGRIVGVTAQGGELRFAAGETVWVLRAPLYGHWFGCTAASVAAAAKAAEEPCPVEGEGTSGPSFGGTFPSDAVKVYDPVGLEPDQCYLLSVDQGLELGRCCTRERGLALRENVALEMRGGGRGCIHAAYAVGDLFASLSPNGIRAYADPEAWMKRKRKQEQLLAQRAPLGSKWSDTDVGKAQAAAVFERKAHGEPEETIGDRIGAAFESGWFRDSVSDGMDNGMSHVEWIAPALDLLSIKSGDIVMEWGYCVGHAVVQALASLEEARKIAGQQPDDRIAALVEETDALKAELASLKEQHENDLAIRVAEELGEG